MDYEEEIILHWRIGTCTVMIALKVPNLYLCIRGNDKGQVGTGNKMCPDTRFVAFVCTRATSTF